MANCIYCGAKVLEEDCPSCGAQEPMEDRESNPSPEYQKKLKTLKKEKMPEKLVEEGTRIHSPGVGILIGVFSALLLGFCCYYLIQEMDKSSKRKKQELESIDNIEAYDKYGKETTPRKRR